MKILLVSPLPPPAGGIATWTVKYQKYCEQHNIPLRIVNSAMNGSRAVQSTAKRRFSDEIERTYFVLTELGKNIKKDKPEIIHLNTPCFKFGIYRDFLCVLFAKLSRVPIVVHCRCNIPDQVRGKLAKWIFSQMAKMADRVLTLNQRSFEYANQFAVGNVITVPNFIETANLIQRERINKKIEHVIYVGRVQKTKGAREIIQAAKHLPEIQFDLIGFIEDEIVKLSIPENVKLHGNQDHAYVLGALNNADAFLFPSYTEGFANALTEAMASGLPVIATDVGANKEMIEDQGGIIIPVGDSDAIVEGLKQLDSDIYLRKTMSDWNIEKVRNNYLQDAVMQKLLDIYKEVLK